LFLFLLSLPKLLYVGRIKTEKGIYSFLKIFKEKNLSLFTIF